MRHLACFLGFNLLILTSQTIHLLAAGQDSFFPVSPGYLVTEHYGNEDGNIGDTSSPPRGSDRRDS